LNDRGVWQAERLACRLRDEKIDVAYSSDLKRAYKTARIIFNPLTTLRVVNGGPVEPFIEGRNRTIRTIKNKVIEKLSEFREMNFGIFEGLTHAEIIQRYPELYKSWLGNLTKVNAPRGEGLRDLSKRVKKRLSFILSRHQGKTIAIIAHGGPIRVVLCDALKYNLEMFWQIGQDIGALNILEYSERLALRVTKMNDTAHLSIKEEIAL
jgi:broad specificity phosphatase PhoE